MSTQLFLARGMVEGRASTWQDMASSQTPMRPVRTVRRRAARLPRTGR